MEQEVDYNEVVQLAKMAMEERSEIRQRDGYRKIFQSCDRSRRRRTGTNCCGSTLSTSEAAQSYQTPSIPCTGGTKTQGYAMHTSTTSTDDHFPPHLPISIPSRGPARMVLAWVDTAKDDSAEGRPVLQQGLTSHVGEHWKTSLKFHSAY